MKSTFLKVFLLSLPTALLSSAWWAWSIFGMSTPLNSMLVPLIICSLIYVICFIILLVNDLDNYRIFLKEYKNKIDYLCKESRKR